MPVCWGHLTNDSGHLDSALPSLHPLDGGLRFDPSTPQGWVALERRGSPGRIYWSKTVCDPRSRISSPHSLVESTRRKRYVDRPFDFGQESQFQATKSRAGSDSSFWSPLAHISSLKALRLAQPRDLGPGGAPTAEER